MTYYGAERVVEHYNVMGPVKAALQAASIYLAAELGPKGYRVHRSRPARSRLGRLPASTGLTNCWKRPPNERRNERCAPLKMWGRHRVPRHRLRQDDHRRRDDTSTVATTSWGDYARNFCASMIAGLWRGSD